MRRSRLSLSRGRDIIETGISICACFSLNQARDPSPAGEGTVAGRGWGAGGVLSSKECAERAIPTRQALRACHPPLQGRDFAGPLISQPLYGALCRRRAHSGP